MNPIYLLYACDAWKSRASMRLLMASTIHETIDGMTCEQLGCGDMQFRGMTGDEAVAAYSVAPNHHELDYGYLECVGDGERL